MENNTELKITIDEIKLVMNALAGYPVVVNSKLADKVENILKASETSRQQSDLEKRIKIVMNALNVCSNDAQKIVDHLIKLNCIEWIDSYSFHSIQPLTDVHYENNFQDMINWQYDDASPFDMLGKSTNISDYPEMLELEDKVIFWYALV